MTATFPRQEIFTHDGLEIAWLDWGGDGFADLNILGFIPEVKFSFILPMICLAVVAIYGYITMKRSKA